MSQIDKLVRDIRLLPYADMMEVAKAVYSGLKQHSDGGSFHDPHTVAEVLSELYESELADSELSKQEEAILRDMFKRKLAIVVQFKDGVWAVNNNSLPASHARADTFRGAMSLMVDQTVSFHALTRK